MKLKSYKVYGLIDPRNNLIRYVGITKRKLSIRLNEHINPSREFRNYKAYWVKKLKSIDLIPIIILLEGNLTKEEASEREIFYIEKYKDNKLTNTTTGGETGYTYLKSVKDKIKNKLTGRTLSDEHRKNIGLASQRPCTEAAKKKLRKKAKKQWANPELLNKMKERTGSNNPNYGGKSGAVCQLNSEGIILKEFDCLGTAASDLEINQKSLRGYIKRGTKVDKYTYKFKKDL